MSVGQKKSTTKESMSFMVDGEAGTTIVISSCESPEGHEGTHQTFMDDIDKNTKWMIHTKSHGNKSLKYLHSGDSFREPTKPTDTTIRPVRLYNHSEMAHYASH
jgi:hypothetical protein